MKHDFGIALKLQLRGLRDPKNRAIFQRDSGNETRVPLSAFNNSPGRPGLVERAPSKVCVTCIQLFAIFVYILGAILKTAFGTQFWDPVLQSLMRFD